MTITYWGSPNNDGFGGKAFADPVQIEAKWEQFTEQMYDDKGLMFVSRAKVWVGVDLDIGGYLYNGVSIVEDPTTVEGAWEIKAFTKIGNRGRTKYERVARL